MYVMRLGLPLIILALMTSGCDVMSQFIPFTTSSESSGAGSGSDGGSTPTTVSSFYEQFGVASNQTTPGAMAVDSDSNVIVAGNTSGGALPGGSWAGEFQDLYILKFDDQANLLWTVQMPAGSSGTVIVNGIAIDSGNNIYISGTTSEALSTAAQISAGDIFVAKLSSSGSLLWLTQLGSSTQTSKTTSIGNLVLDTSGNIYFAGYTTGYLSYSGNVGAMIGTQDGIVGELNSSGAVVFVKQYGASGASVAFAGIDRNASTGNLYVTGGTNQSLTGSSITGSSVPVVCEVNSSGGGFQVLTQIDGSSVNTDASANGLRLLANGDIIFGGSILSAGIDGNTLVGVSDIFMAKINSSGTMTWLKEFGVAGAAVSSFGFYGDTSGNSYSTGYTTAAVGSDPQSGTIDGFTVKYDTNGNQIWAHQVGGASGLTPGIALAIDSANSVYMSGYTSVGLEGAMLTGLDDTFIVKYAADGTAK